MSAKRHSGTCRNCGRVFGSAKRQPFCSILCSVELRTPVIVTGAQIGDWTVMSVIDGRSNKRERMYKCQCVCGDVEDVKSGALRRISKTIRARTTCKHHALRVVGRLPNAPRKYNKVVLARVCVECGQEFKSLKRAKRCPACNRPEFQSGNKFGLWTVASAGVCVDKGRNKLHQCVCQCGKKCTRSTSQLRQAQKKGSGCLQCRRSNRITDRWSPCENCGVPVETKSRTRRKTHCPRCAGKHWFDVYGVKMTSVEIGSLLGSRRPGGMLAVIKRRLAGGVSLLTPLQRQARVTCGLCKEVGHNRLTCRLSTSTFAQDSD
jgi:hypothetical protein